MKFVLFSLMVISIPCFAQIDLAIKIETPPHFHFYEPLQRVGLRVGEDCGYANDKSVAIVKNLPLSALFDTLKIEYPNMRFEEKQILKYDFSIDILAGRPTLSFTVRGIPHFTQYVIDVPVARSPIVKMPSQSLSVYIDAEVEGCTITLIDKNHRKVTSLDDFVTIDNLKFYKKAVPYANLQDGFLEVLYNEKRLRFPFKATDWTQPIYLNIDHVNIESKADKLHFISLLVEQDKHANKQHEQLEDSIRTLNNHIFFLEHGYVIEPKILEKTKICDMAIGYGSPIGGFEHFSKVLKESLGERSVEFSGVLLIKLMISRDGKISVHPVSYNKPYNYHKKYLVSYFDDIFLDIKHHFDNHRFWHETKVQGRMVKNGVLLYLNFTKSN